MRHALETVAVFTCSCSFSSALLAAPQTLQSTFLTVGNGATHPHMCLGCSVKNKSHHAGGPSAVVWRPSLEIDAHGWGTPEQTQALLEMHVAKPTEMPALELQLIRQRKRRYSSLKGYR